jgi:hypothetical protein
MKKPFWIIFAATVAVFLAVNVSLRASEKKNAPVEQNIELVKITVTAPPFVRQESLEQKAKEALKDKAKTVYFFSSSYRKADYLVQYSEYKNEAKLQGGIDSLVSKFKDKKLEYEVIENEVSACKGMLLEGTFEKDGKKFGIKEQLIKRKTEFWQILTIYPYSEKNNKAAGSFIKSVSVGSFEK